MDQAIYTLGIDVGKTWFHLVGTNRAGKPIYRKKLSRAQLLPTVVQLAPDLTAMEACPGAQYLARAMLDHGLTVRLMAAQFVKPYVKSQKNDFNDATAIAEAARRPTMRFAMPCRDRSKMRTMRYRWRYAGCLIGCRTVGVSSRKRLAKRIGLDPSDPLSSKRRR